MPTYIVYYSQGNSNGPFDIYLSGSSGLNLYASNIPKYELVNGFTVTFPDGIPSSSVDVFDVSYGCFTDQNVPFPSVSPSITPSISITPTRTPSITVSPSVTPSISVTPTATPSITPPPSITPSITPSVTVSTTPNPTPTVTRTPSPSPPPQQLLLYVGTQPIYAAGYIACSSWFSGVAPVDTFYYVRALTNNLTGYTLFSNPEGDIPVIGNNKFIVLSYQGTGVGEVIQVNNVGLILNWAQC